jgi:tRNA(Ile)-lysidine synthase
MEAAARGARYEALAAELASDEILLTAHHEDDQLETVLLQLMRGAGIAGLAAMPEVAPFARGTLARPLLTRSRAELEAWARANELTWVEDDSNANEQFDRNYLRRRVLPLIRERWPSAAHAASRSARHAAEAKGLLDALALADVERASNGASLSVQALRALAPDRRRNAVRYWIVRAGHVAPDATRLDEITRTLLDARPDANPRVDWNASRIQRHADHLALQPLAPTARMRASPHAQPADTPDAFYRGDAPDAADPLDAANMPAAARYASARHARKSRTAHDITKSASSSATPASSEGTAWNWRASPRLQLPDSQGTLEILPDPHGPIDLTTLSESLTIRHRQGGERLRPGRNARTKTLKSLLQQSRIPLTDRAHLPLVFSDTKLIAVADRWLDHSIQATSTTQQRARLYWHRNAG